MTAPEKDINQYYESEVFQLQVYDELEEYGLNRPLHVLTLSEKRLQTSFKYAYLFHIVGAILGGVIGFVLGSRGMQDNLFYGVSSGVAGIFIGWLVGAVVSLLTELPKNLTRSRKRGKSKTIAKKLVKNKEIRQLLCPALRSASSDVWEIAKIVTPILYASSIAGSISIPRDPVVFAALAIVVARMGIMSLCVDNDKK